MGVGSLRSVCSHPSALALLARSGKSTANARHHLSGLTIPGPQTNLRKARTPRTASGMPAIAFHSFGAISKIRGRGHASLECTVPTSRFIVTDILPHCFACPHLTRFAVTYMDISDRTIPLSDEDIIDNIAGVLLLKVPSSRCFWRGTSPSGQGDCQDQRFAAHCTRISSRALAIPISLSIKSWS